MSLDLGASIATSFICPTARDVVVWRLRLGSADSVIHNWLQALPASEQQRAASFRRQVDIERFVLGRTALRRILARCLAIVPAEVQLTADSRGKLRLGGAETQWEFNLSHSGSYVLVALAWGRDVGVDVETIKPDFPVDVATRFFAPDELTQLNSLPTHERARAFYALWTCKEAVLKAHGMGLSIPLSSFSVTAFSSPSPSLVRWADDLKPELTWRLWSLALDAAHLGALAVRHDPTEATVRLFYCDNLPTEPLGEH